VCAMSIRAFSAVLAVLLWPCFGFSKEVDQFSDRLFQLRHLPNSSEMIDREINRMLVRLEHTLNRVQPVDLKKTRQIIYQVFQGRFLAELRTPFEYWVRNSSDITLYWPEHRGVYGGTVNYDDMGLGWYVEISPVIRLGNFLVGIDKLGHFIGQGWYYDSFYNKLLTREPHLSPSEMFGRVRDYGHQLEASYLGATGTAVYSYGDLAANWQGFRFYRQLLAGSKPYIEFKNGRYRLQRSFRILDYVSDDWDEVLNPSRVLGESFYRKVSDNVRWAACRDFRKRTRQFLNQSGRKLRRESYVSSLARSHEMRDPYFLDVKKICTQLEKKHRNKSASR